MVERDGAVSLSRQCRLLGLSRAALYYRPVEAGGYQLELMALIDRQYLRAPFYGSRRMTVSLREQGHAVNRKRVKRLMQLMGLEAIYQRPRTSRPAPNHRIYPYLLRGLSIERINQVWAADICYIPMARGFLYLVAVMDWVSRYVLAWRLSNLLEASFCVDALEEALTQGRPEIFNTDQGSQFTDGDFTGVLGAHGIAISMDGRGRFSDNIFVERLWRSLKYEEVYLKAYESVAQARAGIAAYFQFYNHERLHQALGYRTPRQVFTNLLRPGKSGSSAIARTAWPTDHALAGAPQCAPASDPKPDRFSPALRS
jgi:putative transposase